VRAGPKAEASRRALPGVSAGSPVDDLDAWLRRWVRVPRGTGAGGPLTLRPFQRALAADVLDPDVRLTVWVCGRGNAKTTTAAALGLHHVVEGPEGATCGIVATDERAALRVLRTATRMVETSPSLSKRVTPYADRLVCPRTGGELLALPAEMRRVEGSDLTLPIADEVGLMERPVWESLLLSQKRAGSTALAIGTPSPPAWRDRAPLLDLVTAGRVGDDPTLRLHEYGSDGRHAVDCAHCRESANPGLGDLLDEAQLLSSLPPKTRDSEYRRARLAQWVEADSESWLTAEGWDACAEPERATDGDVVLILDGSFSQDSTAVLGATISPRPHLFVVGLWESPPDDPSWRVDVVEVEDAIREAARRLPVREVAADPFRWTRSLQVLAADGLPVVEFPQTSQRMSPATTGLTEAVLNREVTHDGDPRLRAHVLNAVLRDDRRGVRLSKVSKHSKRRIDLAVCGVMGHARATWHARSAPPKRRRRVVSW
jgi:phage terminase large subunit-like protein